LLFILKTINLAEIGNMKVLCALLLIAVACSVSAQKSIFIRVFDLAGKKINKGHMVAVTDSSLSLEGKPLPVIVPLSAIGFIKTKRSAGNNLLIGSIVGASSMAILFAATAEPDAEFVSYSAAEGAAGGALLGLAFGAAIGALTIPFKGSKYYPINGDRTNWKQFLSAIAEQNSKRKQ
jgi:hypothetical protein